MEALEAERKPPRVVECPNCHGPVAASDDLCPYCGTYFPPTFAESQR